MTKYIILDSGTLINLASNGLLDIFRELAKSFQGEFLITETVKYETISHPMQIKRFELGALRIEHLLNDDVIKLAEEIVSRQEIEKKSQEILSIANSSFFANNKSIHLIEKGEAECLALSLILTEKKIDNVVSIDERTARMLCEYPENLRKIMENKLKMKISLKERELKSLQEIKVIRSTELMYLASKKGLLDGDKRTVEAVLYALKFGGCSITEKEVEIMKKNY